MNMKLLTTILALGAVAIGLSQQAPQAFRIPVRHADPWMIKAMLEGQAVRSPELSCAVGIGGLGAAVIAAINATGSILRDGILVVNAADNSLWWMPKPKKQ